MRHAGLRIGLCLAMAMATIGCGKAPGPKTLAVTGKITLDGKPLESGSINFIPSDGVSVSSGGKISAGYYRADVPLGSKRVEIWAPKVVGQKDAYEGDPKSPKIDIIQELIPEKYNSKSELTANVEAGKTKFDFTLEIPKQ